MGAIFDNNKTVPLTEDQKQRWKDAVATMDDTFLPQMAWQGEGTEHKYVYVASFDGTWNDRENVRPDETPTSPAQLEAALSKHYDSNLAGNYYHGVGTRENAIMRIIDGMTGNGTEQRAESAFKDFQKQAQDWIKSDPEAQIQVFTMGFSRGSASARHFLNLVDERGVPADAGTQFVLESPYSESSSFETKVVQTYDKFLREPGSIPSSALLYDTVATGQESNLKLGIPASTRFVAHLTSENEMRRAFPLTAIDGRTSNPADSRLLSVSLPGIHSDIGGGYPEGVAKLSRYMGEQVLYRLGFDVEPGKFPMEALEEGRHRNLIDIGSLAEMGAPDEPDSPHRRTKYVENATLSEAQLAELAHENRTAELAAAVRYVENLTRGSAPQDPLGFENLGIALSPHKDGTMDVLISNPKAMQFDEHTGEISVYGKVVHKLSDADYAQLKSGDPIVEVFSVLPQHTLAAEVSDKPLLTGDIPKVGQSSPAPAAAAAASEAGMPAAVPSM